MSAEIFAILFATPLMLSVLWIINRDREDSRKFAYKCLAERVEAEYKILNLEREIYILRNESSQHVSESDITRPFARPSLPPNNNENN